MHLKRDEIIIGAPVSKSGHKNIDTNSLVGSETAQNEISHLSIAQNWWSCLIIIIWWDRRDQIFNAHFCIVNGGNDLNNFPYNFL